MLSCSDMFFGHKHNLIMPGRAVNMSDGWETKRRRGPGHDWVTIKLGKPGTIRCVEVDTSYFKGNFPDSCSLEATQDTAGLSCPNISTGNPCCRARNYRRIRAISLKTRSWTREPSRT